MIIAKRLKFRYNDEKEALWEKEGERDCYIGEARKRNVERNLRYIEICHPICQ